MGVVDIVAGTIVAAVEIAVLSTAMGVVVTSALQAPNWEQQRVPSTNQHPISTGTKPAISHTARAGLHEHTQAGRWVRP